MIDPRDLVPVEPNDAGAAKDLLKMNGVSLTVLGPGEDAGIIRFAEINGKSWCLVRALS